MYTICIANQKGGVSKTTTAAAIAAGLHRKGLRVLCVDTDAQRSLTRMTGADETRPTLYDVLRKNKTTVEAIQHTDAGDVIPADARLSDERLFIGRGREYDLRERLDAVKDVYDVCILDTPPALSIMTVNALTAADGVLVPTKPDLFSLQALQDLYGTFETVRSMTNSRLVLLGVIVTMYDRRTKQHTATLEAMTAQAKEYGTKVYSPPIRRTVAAELWQYAVDIYGSRSTAAQDYEAITAQLIKDINLKGAARNGKQKKRS